MVRAVVLRGWLNVFRAAPGKPFNKKSIAMASVFVQLFGGLINVSASAKKKAISWDRQFVKIVRWAKSTGRLPEATDEKRLYNWLDDQRGRYEIGELDVVQSRKIARLVQVYGQEAPGRVRRRVPMGEVI